MKISVITSTADSKISTTQNNTNALKIYTVPVYLVIKRANISSVYSLSLNLAAGLPL